MAARQRLDCAHRGTCLMTAARAGWDGFACAAGCGAYQPLTGEAAAFELEALGMLGLLLVAPESVRRTPKGTP